MHSLISEAKMKKETKMTDNKVKAIQALRTSWCSSNDQFEIHPPSGDFFLTNNEQAYFLSLFLCGTAASRLPAIEKRAKNT